MALWRGNVSYHCWTQNHFRISESQNCCLQLGQINATLLFIKKKNKNLDMFFFFNKGQQNMECYRIRYWVDKIQFSRVLFFSPITFTLFDHLQYWENGSPKYLSISFFITYLLVCSEVWWCSRHLQRSPLWPWRLVRRCEMKKTIGRCYQVLPDNAVEGRHGKALVSRNLFFQTHFSNWAWKLAWQSGETRRSSSASRTLLNSHILLLFTLFNEIVN